MGHKLTNNEAEQVGEWMGRFDAAKDLLNKRAIPSHLEIEELLMLSLQLRYILGNHYNFSSLLAGILARRYLEKRFPGLSYDSARKEQGAKGLDIDVRRKSGERIIGEIKTTVPFEQVNNDFSAAQKKSITNDIRKLEAAKADYKFFFLTDETSSNIVRSRYLMASSEIEVQYLDFSLQESAYEHRSIEEILREYSCG